MFKQITEFESDIDLYDKKIVSLIENNSPENKSKSEKGEKDSI